MRNETRRKFNAYMAQQARLNGVDSAGQQFAVEPSIQQTLESKVQESSALLQRVNMIGVDELKGEKVDLGVTGPIAGRTNVNNGDRQTRDVKALEADGYECVSTEFDTHVGWGTLDAWAKFPDFQTRLRDQILRRQALDRLMIGWNGRSAAANTDLSANPMLQDVNIGWLQKYRNNAVTRVMAEGKVAGEITYGDPSADYKTLDALVYDITWELLDEWHRNDPDIVAMTSRDLMHDKYFPLVNDYDAPTERNALDLIMTTKRMGGHAAAGAPYMPQHTILATPFDNLSLYWQIDSRRRYLVDEPKRKRIENYDSSNDAYVVEDYGRGVLIENVYAYDEAPSNQA